MELGDCKVTIGDRTFRATNVRFDYSPGELDRVTVEAFEEPKHETIKATWASEIATYSTDTSSGNLVFKAPEHLHSTTIKQTGTAGFGVLPYRVTENNSVTKRYVEENMSYESEKACAEDSYYGSDSLARKYRNLELDEDERLLRKHDIVELDGTLTRKGKDFIINVLFDHFTEEVVDALREIDEADALERERK